MKSRSPELSLSNALKAPVKFQIDSNPLSGTHFSDFEISQCLPCHTVKWGPALDYPYLHLRTWGPSRWDLWCHNSNILWMTLTQKSVKFTFCGLWVQNLWEISKVPFEIAHQVSNPYIAKCAFYEVLKFLRLMSLSETYPCWIKPEPTLVSKLCMFAESTFMSLLLDR